MHGHAHREGRAMRYDGTRATLRASAVEGAAPEITIYDHLTDTVERVDIPALSSADGHQGGDTGVMDAFVQAVRARRDAGMLTSGRTSLESHLLAFAAEESRATGASVDMAAYRARLHGALAVGGN